MGGGSSSPSCSLARRTRASRQEGYFSKRISMPVASPRISARSSSAAIASIGGGSSGRSNILANRAVTDALNSLLIRALELLNHVSKNSWESFGFLFFSGRSPSLVLSCDTNRYVVPTDTPVKLKHARASPEACISLSAYWPSSTIVLQGWRIYSQRERSRREGVGLVGPAPERHLE